MDDEQKHLKYNVGDILKGTYEIVGTLGKGVTANVVKVKDLKKDRILALKIIKNTEQAFSTAMDEISVLQKLAAKDSTGMFRCIKMIDWFEYSGHICISFDLLGKSIFDFFKENDNNEFPMEQARYISYQLCHAVNFLHGLQLTHTDLKPENILFVDSDYETVKIQHKKKKSSIRRVRNAEIRLIDFGYATFDQKFHRKKISTCHYRAPEVILELGWSQPSDVWSIGCIMFELYTGIPLFQLDETEDMGEHLAMMERILGPIPSEVFGESQTTYFRNGKLVFDVESSTGLFVREQCFELSEYMRSKDENTTQLFDLISKLLNYDANQRISLMEALEHPFFAKIPPHLRIG